MRFQEFVSSDVNGTSLPVAAADPEPVGFAVGGEGEDRVAGQRAVGRVKIPGGRRWRRSVGHRDATPAEIAANRLWYLWYGVGVIRPDDQHCARPPTKIVPNWRRHLLTPNEAKPRWSSSSWTDCPVTWQSLRR